MKKKKLRGLPQDHSSGIFCKRSISKGTTQPVSTREGLVMFCQQPNHRKKHPHATCLGFLFQLLIRLHTWGVILSSASQSFNPILDFSMRWAELSQAFLIGGVRLRKGLDSWTLRAELFTFSLTWTFDNPVKPKDPFSEEVFKMQKTKYIGLNTLEKKLC